MKQAIAILSAVTLVLVIFFTSCKKDDSTITPDHKTAQQRSGSSKKSEKVTSTHQVCGTPTVVELIAGQYSDAGTVTVSNDANNLTVTYSTTGGWSLRELHLYVGDCALIPKNGSGNPTPGRFPYSVNLNGALTYSFTIPLTNLPNCFCVAAHAVVSNSRGGTETAWGAGTRFVNQGNWATYFSACKQNCTPVCITPPSLLFGGEVEWPNGPSVIVGGYTYTVSATGSLLSAPSSDAKNALFLIATLKVYGTGLYPPASVVSDSNIVEAWLATLGQLTSSSQYTAPANVEAAIADLQAWEASQYCQ
jgi:hypothetical protein